MDIKDYFENDFADKEQNLDDERGDYFKLQQINGTAYTSTVVSSVKDKGDVSDGFHTFNQLYDYRMVYNALLMNEFYKQGKYNCYKSTRHEDGELCFGGGWFVVSMTLPTGTVTNHYENKYWDLFQVEERETAEHWDGHTPKDALMRMLDFGLQDNGAENK